MHLCSLISSSSVMGSGVTVMISSVCFVCEAVVTAPDPRVFYENREDNNL
jgi:hypothetical protein